MLDLKEINGLKTATLFSRRNVLFFFCFILAINLIQILAYHQLTIPAFLFTPVKYTPKFLSKFIHTIKGIHSPKTLTAVSIHP